MLSTCAINNTPFATLKNHSSIKSKKLNYKQNINKMKISIIQVALKDKPCKTMQTYNIAKNAEPI
jgi:hypothetical protein